MLYNPGPPPHVDGSQYVLLQYMQNELRNIAAAFLTVESIELQVLNVEPSRPRNGMIVLADGTNFNPGSGAGFYGRSAGTWVFLG